jgi:hypothetical protein
VKGAGFGAPYSLPWIADIRFRRSRTGSAPRLPATAPSNIAPVPLTGATDRWA